MIKRFLFAATMLLFANILLAYDFSAVSNGTTLYYRITSSTAPYTVSITYPNDTATTIWDTYVGYTQPSGTITIPSTVTNNGITYTVTNIGDTAFAHCNNLTSITIPNSVTSIGDYAFYQCMDLASVTIPNSVTSIGNYAFHSCPSLTSVTIPNSVTSIGNSAFWYCVSLTSITIPNSVTSIGEEAFRYNRSLTTVNFNADSCVYMGSSNYSVFSDCNNLRTLTIGNNVKVIPMYAFSGCSGLSSVTIPNSVKSIGEYAFRNNTSLTTVNFNADSCVYMGSSNYSVFSGCNNLRTLTIGNNVKTIPNYAFSGCTNLTRTNYTGTIAQWCNIDFDYSTANPVYYSHNLYINNQLVTNLVIPNTVNTIKAYAFWGDTCITSVTIGNSVTSIGSYAFSSCIGLTSVNIPNSVTTIGSGAFEYCSGLTSVTIGSSVTSIGSSAFGNCTGLTSVTIGNSVTNIGGYAFSSCIGLTSVNIPNSVTTIGGSAFEYCSGLTSVTIGSSVKRIGSGAFDGDINLRRTNYTGTIAQWCDINFVNYTSNPLSYSHNLYVNNQLVANQLVIPNTVDTIKSWAFVDCPGLTSITIPNSVISIGVGAFYGCTNLDSITIPIAIKSIEANAFAGCTGLRTMNYNADSCILKCYHFWGNVFTPFGNDVDSCYLMTLNIGDSVRYISDSAFYGCSKLTRTNYTGTIAQWCDIDFGNEYSNPVFYSRNLYINNMPVTNLVIPNTVNTIKSWFRNDTCITSVTIPNSVTNIEGNAFNSCTGLTSITFRRANTTIGNNNFNGLPAGLPIHIPCGSSAWYINKLPNFSNFIEELQYSYLVTSQDTVKGSVATITAPTCNSTSWTIRATANTGYTFSHWSDGDTNTQRTLTVNRDTALIAYFVSVPWYTFSVVSEDTLKGTVQIITQPSQANPQATFVAVPNTGYTFSRWSDGNTQNPRSITVTQDTALVAYFTGGSLPQWYRFSVVSEDTLKGTVQIVTQPSQANPQATFVALPNTGYTFSRWSDGNTQNPRTLTVTQDTALVAYFTANTPQWYRFSVMSEDTLKGTVQIITQPSQSNPQATFVAVPNTGYTFSRWSDGNTQNPRSITVTQDTILIAFFSSNQGIAKAESANITLYPNPASETVTITGIGNEANILVINAMGKVIRRYENVGGTVTFSVGVLPKGIYFVRMGNAVSKLVVE